MNQNNFNVLIAIGINAINRTSVKKKNKIL